MKTTFVTPELSAESFYAFVKLNREEKTKQIKKHGILVDTDSVCQDTINLYFMNGFFVETTVSATDNTITDIVPYKQGYKMKQYFETTHVLTLKNADLLKSDISAGKKRSTSTSKSAQKNKTTKNTKNLHLQ